MSAELDLSIVVPSYNSAPWLPSTLHSIEAAAERSRLRVEIIVVDDGSLDSTHEIVERRISESRFALHLISQENTGVFAARRAGAEAAKADWVLFVDSRVIVESDALQVIEQSLSNAPLPLVGHVTTATDGPLVGRFWEVPTHVFWGSYLRAPAPTLITPDNFDSVPKGTGFLLTTRASFIEACASVDDAGSRFVSDDTKLLRFMTTRQPLMLDPRVRAVYRPRTTVRRFLAHGFLRGTLFVDSYYGTSAVRSVVLWLVALSVPVVMAAVIVSLLAGWGWILLVLAAAFLLLIGVLLAIAAINRAPGRSIASFLVYFVPFTGVFWAGVTRGLLLRFGKRSR